MVKSESKCKCKICSAHKKIDKIIHSRDVDKLIELVTKLEDENLNLGFELDYLNAIIDGSWGSSVKILTKALERAKKYAIKRPS